MGTRTVDPLIGQLVDDRYQVTVRIARGGMATVYRALDRRLDREVALKVMHPHLTEGADFVARFRREARAAARLVHPGVVSVFDQGTAGDSPYLVMEFIDGPNLRAHLRSAGSLPLGEALSITAQVLDALALAHNQGLVHRDVKPENILIAPGGRVKVADFGLARAMSEVTMATTGVVLGTVAYLSPEVVQQGAADSRSDVYACGILLYELITGSQPFEGTNVIQVAYQHVNRNVPAPSAKLPWVPYEVDALVRVMTNRNPDERPADAAAALELVRSVRHNLSPDVLEQQSNETQRLDPALLPDALEEAVADIDALFEDPDRTEIISPEDAAAITGVGSTVALPVGAPALDSALGPDDEEGRRPRHLKKALIALGLVILLVAGSTGWYFLAGPGSRVPVPPVVGLNEEQAIEMLEAKNLKSTTSREFSDTVKEGFVVSASPAPGTPIAKDGTVAIVVSKGIQMLPVPKLTGITEKEAIALLGQVGLSAAPVAYEFSLDVPENFVISSDPAEGTSIPHNQQVALVVSKGAEPIQMPKLVGLDEKTANDTLTGLNLTATVQQEYSKEAPAGVVIAQSPNEGAPLHRGNNVAYTLSKGPPLVSVPDVFKQDVDDATEALKALGFKVKKETPQKVTPLGQVYQQEPAAGSQAPEGSTVTIYVF